MVRKVVLDTNLYIGWLNDGRHEDLFLGRGVVRHLSAVVAMELRVGATMLPARRAVDRLVRAYAAGKRLFAPTPELFDVAGHALRRLREDGREIRQASFVNDVLIAVSARSIGATLFTADAGYEAIGSAIDFDLVVVGA